MEFRYGEDDIYDKKKLIIFIIISISMSVSSMSSGFGGASQFSSETND
jgi:hypothetical protein